MDLSKRRQLGYDAVVEHEKLADGDRYTTSRGVMLIRRPARHVEVISGHGFAEEAFIEPILASRDEIVLECGEIALFDDLERVTGYDTAVRVRLTAWGREHRSHIVAHHILTRSKLVAMGVSVASLALGGAIEAHSRRDSFDGALRGQVKRGASGTA